MTEDTNCTNWHEFGGEGGDLPRKNTKVAKGEGPGMTLTGLKYSQKETKITKTRAKSFDHGCEIRNERRLGRLESLEDA
jgi:hypothetical protein